MDHLTDGSEKRGQHEKRPPTVMRRSLVEKGREKLLITQQPFVRENRGPLQKAVTGQHVGLAQGRRRQRADVRR